MLLLIGHLFYNIILLVLLKPVGLVKIKYLSGVGL